MVANSKGKWSDREKVKTVTVRTSTEAQGKKKTSSRPDTQAFRSRIRGGGGGWRRQKTGSLWHAKCAENHYLLILKATAILRRRQYMQWLKMQRFPIKQSYTMWLQQNQGLSMYTLYRKNCQQFNHHVGSYAIRSMTNSVPAGLRSQLQCYPDNTDKAVTQQTIILVSKRWW